MNHSWSEVNAAILTVLAGWVRPVGAAGGGLARARGGPDAAEVYADRLLGVRQAEGLADRGEVRIVAGTVVTPLARDLLRRRGVAVRVVSGREAVLARGGSRGEWGFAIDAPRQPGLAEALRRHWLATDWCAIGRDPAGWVLAAGGRGALVVADEGAVAAWRANRAGGIRAATVGDLDATDRAVRHLGANLLVVEPAGRSIHLIRQVGARFRAGGAPLAPDWDRDDEGACR